MLIAATRFRIGARRLRNGMGKMRRAERSGAPLVAGRARVGHAVGRARLPEHALTQHLKLDGSEPEAVFVDPSGVRRRRLRRWAYLLAAVLVCVLAAVWLSQLGGPVRPADPVSCPTAHPGPTGPAGRDCRR
jgi:hypothetical protein